MAVLKGLVVTMGFLIIALLGLMIYGLYQKSQDPNFSFFKDSPPAPTQQASTQQAQTISPPVSGDTFTKDHETPTQATVFGDIDLNLGQTAKIVSANISANRLVLVVARNGTQADVVVVLDMATGKILGRVSTTP